MSFELKEESKWIQSENMNIDNYVEEKELRKLQGKIIDMERNYKSMEKKYTNIIKELYQMLHEKHSEYQQLRLQIAQLNYLGEQHKKQMEQILQKHKRNQLRYPHKSKEKVRSECRSLRKPHQSSSSSLNKKKLSLFSPHSHRQLIKESFKTKKRRPHKKGSSSEESVIKLKNYLSPKRDKVGKLVPSSSSINLAVKQRSLNFFSGNAFIFK